MSLSSLRERDDNIAGLHAAWFAANAQDYVWRYPWQTETKQTVQEYQGGQHSAEVWGLINHYYNHQTHKQAWERIRDLVLTADNRPIMGFWWAAGGGHAVVPYRTEIAGADHRIVLYDNNHQYAENETCGADPDVAIVNWNTSSFSYAGANKMICLSYDECTQPQHLPAEATGGGMGIVAAVFEQGARVSQIQDSQGRRFFNADGSINNDPATRIPDSMKYVAFMGPEIPPGYPDIFIFSNATGKSLTFNVSGTGQKLCRFFMPGDVLEVQAGGQGQIILQNILTNQRGLQIPNPGALQLLSIQSIKVLTFDRGYLLNNFRNLGANKLLLLSKADGNSLDIESNGALQCNLLLSSFAAGKAVQGSFSNIEFAANSRATLQPPAWTALATGELGLQLRNLQNNQLIRDIKLPPGQ